MQLIFIIMKQLDKTDDLMIALANAGIKGATIIESSGMAKVLYKLESIPAVDILGHILNKENTNASQTILIAVSDDMVDVVRKTAKDILGDLSIPNAGVIFGVPVSFSEGI